MKSASLRLASTLLCVAFATASFAATKPISYPKGLAVDSKGNLYVANSGGNDILIYNASYVQVTAKTITSNISNPSGVAIDAQGNLWVANYGTSNGGANGSIAEYTNGKQNTSATITANILGPQALAVDGAGNVWVANDDININVYNAPALYVTGSTLARSFSPNFPIYGITVQNGTLAWGTNGAVNFASTTLGLVNGTLNYLGYSNDDGFALAADNVAGSIYMCNLDGSVNVAVPSGEYTFELLSFPAAGAAIDSVRHRAYFSNYNGNSISVYSTTTGALLTTIH